MLCRYMELATGGQHSSIDVSESVEQRETSVEGCGGLPIFAPVDCISEQSGDAAAQLIEMMRRQATMINKIIIIIRC